MLKIFQNNTASKSDLERWTLLLILASATCCFGSALPAGYNIGVMNNGAEVSLYFLENKFENFWMRE